MQNGTQKAKNGLCFACPWGTLQATTPLNRYIQVNLHGCFGKFKQYKSKTKQSKHGSSLFQTMCYLIDAAVTRFHLLSVGA